MDHLHNETVGLEDGFRAVMESHPQQANLPPLDRQRPIVLMASMEVLKRLWMWLDMICPPQGSLSALEPKIDEVLETLESLRVRGGVPNSRMVAWVRAGHRWALKLRDIALWARDYAERNIVNVANKGVDILKVETLYPPGKGQSWLIARCNELVGLFDAFIEIDEYQVAPAA